MNQQALGRLTHISRLTHLSYEVSEMKSEPFADALKKILAQLPKSAPDTVVVRETSTRARFDLRYMTEMLWNRAQMYLNVLGAKEVEQTYLGRKGFVRVPK